MLAASRVDLHAIIGGLPEHVVDAPTKRASSEGTPGELVGALCRTLDMPDPRLLYGSGVGMAVNRLAYSRH